jgi:transcription antitermination factor NusG
MAPESTTTEALWATASAYDLSKRAPLPALWYALVVRPRHERTAADFLRRQSFESFLPLYRTRHRWSDRVKELELPLFPGYVFCRFSPNYRRWVENAPGVRRTIDVAGRLASIPESEIETVKRIVSSQLAAEPWPGVEPGTEVVIQDGPLCGMRGVVTVVKKRCRLFVSVLLLNRSISVEIEPSWVLPSVRAPSA